MTFTDSQLARLRACGCEETDVADVEEWVVVECVRRWPEYQVDFTMGIRAGCDAFVISSGLYYSIEDRNYEIAPGFDVEGPRTERCETLTRLVEAVCQN